MDQSHDSNSKPLTHFREALKGCAFTLKEKGKGHDKLHLGKISHEMKTKVNF